MTVPHSSPGPQQGPQSGQSGRYQDPRPGVQQGQAPAPDPRPRGTGKAPTILMIIGGVVLVLSLAIGITLAVIGISTTSGGIKTIEVFDSGSGGVAAEEGDVLQLYKEAGTSDPSCRITGPSEGAVGEGTIQTSATTVDGEQWQSFDSVTAHEAGVYRVDCAGTPVAVGPPVSLVGIFGAVGGILLGLGGGFLGLVLLGLGVLLLVLRKREVRE